MCTSQLIGALKMIANTCYCMRGERLPLLSVSAHKAADRQTGNRQLAL